MSSPSSWPDELNFVELGKPVFRALGKEGGFGLFVGGEYATQEFPSVSISFWHPRKDLASVTEITDDEFTLTKKNGRSCRIIWGSGARAVANEINRVLKMS